MDSDSLNDKLDLDLKSARATLLEFMMYWTWTSKTLVRPS